MPTDRTATWRALERQPIPEWFRDATYGVYFHWGPYSVPAYGSEWYPREMYQPGSEVHDHHVETYGDPSEFGYKEFIPEFHGDRFDADELAALCAENGAEFVGITAIHHDGFALWDSDLTEWNAAEMGPERDVLGDLAAAVREHGMKFVAAFHHAWNWWYYPRVEGFDTMDPEYAGLYGQPHAEGEDPPESYYADWRDKTLEAMARSRPDLAWFDFGWGNGPFLAHDSYRRDVVAGYYEMAEQWGKAVGIAHKRNLPVGVGIVDYERSRREALSVRPWLTDTSIDRTSWGYVSDPAFKSPETLVTGLVDRASKNGTTLLNVGPRPDGTVPEEARQRIAALGDWVETNRAAVEGRPWWHTGEGPTEVTSGEFEEASSVSFVDGDLRFTRSAAGDVGYVILLAWPEDGEVEIATSLNRRLTGRGRGEDPVDPERIDLLGADVDVDWAVDPEAGTLRVDLPDEPPDGLAYAYTLRLTPP